MPQSFGIDQKRIRAALETVHCCGIIVSKLGIVIEEADESLYWMELLVESNLMKEGRMSSIMQEANELVSIFTAAVITSKKKSNKNQNDKS